MLPRTHNRPHHHHHPNMKCSTSILVAVCLVSLVVLATFSSSANADRVVRAKRDAFDILIKKKGLGAAATALIAAKAIKKKKFVPIPIPFPLPILKPPIIEPIPYPIELLKLNKIASLGAGLHGFGGFGGFGR